MKNYAWDEVLVRTVITVLCAFIIWLLVVALPARADTPEDVAAQLVYLQQLEQRIEQMEADTARLQRDAQRAGEAQEQHERQQRHQRNAQLNTRCSMAGSIPNWSTGGCF